jgi:superoxide reductase
MAQHLEIYKCTLCGNIVEVFIGGAGALSCCNQPMVLQAENTVDASQEKHLPVINRGNGTITVKVGSIPHPMEESHYIQWIELIADGTVYRKELKPGQAPEATFPITAAAVAVREYCNIHGQWKSEG